MYFFFFLENEALGAKTDHAKDLVGGFKRASSMISLTSELAGDIDGLELLSTVDVDEPPGEIANEPPGPPDKPPGAAAVKKPLPRTRKVLGEKNEENRKEFVEKFLTGNTFNNCVFHF